MSITIRADRVGSGCRSMTSAVRPVLSRMWCGGFSGWGKSQHEVSRVERVERVVWVPGRTAEYPVARWA
ncbi:hypothetical protein GCM10023086_45350 [Streptomyces venetus]|uniref:Transposase n=1 Tax=Streptomyces venetus TaxID=1701086 RepID=A0ABP8GAU5_9ACTN